MIRDWYSEKRWKILNLLWRNCKAVSSSSLNILSICKVNPTRNSFQLLKLIGHSIILKETWIDRLIGQQKRNRISLNSEKLYHIYKSFNLSTITKSNNSSINFSNTKSNNPSINLSNNPWNSQAFHNINQTFLFLYIPLFNGLL